ncbi:MAG: hypothetical protein KGQ37_13005 [Hyphomicrobiales bacterium]|nr:hypothetical protein [Hyphomicrobiales bacterium]
MVMLFCPKCAACGASSARIEVIAPHELPDQWPLWPASRRELFATYRDPSAYRLLYEGPGGSNGLAGDALDPQRAAAIIAAFAGSPATGMIMASGIHDGAGWCPTCRAFYCADHWSLSSTGHGRCPKGHSRSLDPHWHP